MIISTWLVEDGCNVQLVLMFWRLLSGSEASLWRFTTNQLETMLHERLANSRSCYIPSCCLPLPPTLPQQGWVHSIARHLPGKWDGKSIWSQTKNIWIMSAHGRRRYEEEGAFCIPGLGDRNYRPGEWTQDWNSDISWPSFVFHFAFSWLQIHCMSNTWFKIPLQLYKLYK